MPEPSWKDWIVSDPEILAGKPRIRDTRISVELILELLASGATVEEILARYPHVPAAGLTAALQFAADALKGDHIWSLRIPA